VVASEPTFRLVSPGCFQRVSTLPEFAELVRRLEPALRGPDFTQVWRMFEDSLAVTSARKVFFSERGETKLDLVWYYLAVAEPLMRAVGGRPTLMQRFPHGADGSSFFQKRVPETTPEWLQTTIASTPNGTTSRALVLADMAHVVWAVNLACLGFHLWPYLPAPMLRTSCASTSIRSRASTSTT
jgi:hypothetical protein